MKRLTVWIVCILFLPSVPLVAERGLGLVDRMVAFEAGASVFPLVSSGPLPSIFVDAGDYPGVKRAARDLGDDFERVTSSRLSVSTDAPAGTLCLVVGTLGRSALIDHLVAEGKIDGSSVAGKWDAFGITTVENPWPGVEKAVVIFGSGKRGTVYGIYELSEQIGVSPWYWWADVVPQKHPEVFFRPGLYISGEPAVRYRGIFINDEAPCLTGWAKEKFGGLNSRFYTKVFELLLRLRANYLWPAMWDNAFNEDDPLNPALADEYGIVMGTSHHEPMMRAHKEWTRRRDQYGNGRWDYATNDAALQRFFREGISHAKGFENVVTMGMRGDGDEGMVSTGDTSADIRLLEKIFDDQRRIIEEELKTKAENVPQIWALFTEVQKYYEAGLRPPDDVTLLWTDDNTGNLRRLPTKEERTRKGGAGIYYHLDMHGGPYAYQWINTNPLPKIAEQMTLAHAYGANRVWIANVGDIKPLEVPLEFFLRLAWNPSRWTKDHLQDYLTGWAEREFGPSSAVEIADIVAKYGKYNGWRKPEQVKPDTFSPLHHQEAEGVERAWSELSARAENIYNQLPPGQRDSYFQLVLYPTKASAGVNRMNLLAGRNDLYAKQGRLSTNLLATEVKRLFQEDQAMAKYYNSILSAGKWNHMMDQPHLGQWSWEPPVVDVMPAVAEVAVRDDARWSVAVEGSADSWPTHFGRARLPVFDSFQKRRSFLDVFAMGSGEIHYTVEAKDSWLVVVKAAVAGPDQRYWVEIDWAKAPVGKAEGRIVVSGMGVEVEVGVPSVKASPVEEEGARGRFSALTGVLAIEAAETPSVTSVNGMRWESLPDYGRGEAAMAVFPVDAPSLEPTATGPALEYPLFLGRSGRYTITLVLGPVMDFAPERGVRLALSFDDQPSQVLDVFADREAETFLGKNWGVYTRDNARFLRTTVEVKEAGVHTLRLSRIDPGVVIQKIILHNRELPYSYFGPAATARLP